MMRSQPYQFKVVVQVLYLLLTKGLGKKEQVKLGLGNQGIRGQVNKETWELGLRNQGTRGQWYQGSANQGYRGQGNQGTRELGDKGTRELKTRRLRSTGTRKLRSRELGDWGTRNQDREQGNYGLGIRGTRQTRNIFIFCLLVGSIFLNKFIPKENTTNQEF